MFGRTELTAPMAQPAEPGTGRIKPLWQHVNVADEDKPVVLAVMIDALIQPDTSKTVAAFQAEHGSAKTSTMKRIVSLIDPSTVDARGAPRNEDHWLSQAVGSWVVALDTCPASQIGCPTAYVARRPVTAASSEHSTPMIRCG
jgi:hypothetical protein